jgi:hypothetical protein
VRKEMTTDLQRSLERAGIRIGEDAFLELVRESVERVVGSADLGGGALDLPPDERGRLEKGGFHFDREGETGHDDPVARGAAEFAALLGSALSVAEAAEHLGVQPARIRQRLGGPPRTLYGVKRDGEWWLPRFQFTRTGLLPGIAEVIEGLDPELNPVAVWRWFTSPNPDLEGDEGQRAVSPLEWLRAGHPPAVLVSLATGL